MTLNIADLFEAVADAIPDRVPLILEDARLNYAELELRSNRLAHHLQSVGVERGSTSVFICATASSTSKRSWLA